MNEIKEIVVISGTGVRRYLVGETINGMKVSRIVCNSIEFPDSMQNLFAGWTNDNRLIFEIINAPVTVEYVTQGDEHKRGEK